MLSTFSTLLPMMLARIQHPDYRADADHGALLRSHAGRPLVASLAEIEVDNRRSKRVDSGLQRSPRCRNSTWW
jgi:hypothetical protein